MHFAIVFRYKISLSIFKKQIIYYNPVYIDLYAPARLKETTFHYTAECRQNKRRVINMQYRCYGTNSSSTIYFHPFSKRHLQTIKRFTLTFFLFSCRNKQKRKNRFDWYYQTATKQYPI